MLKGNEYGAINLSSVSPERNLHGAKSIIEGMIEDSIEFMDVQPPTSESLTTSTLKGIEVGRELQRRGFGKLAVDQAVVMIKMHNFSGWPCNDNATAFGHSAEEAYLANGFRYLTSDFENPVEPEIPYHK